MKSVVLFLLLSVFSAAVIIQSQTVEALTIPERCTIPVPLHCKDYATINESIKIVLYNDGTKGMTIKNINVQSEAFLPLNRGDSNHNCSLSFQERNQLLKNGTQKVFTLNVSTESGKKCSYYHNGRSRNKYNITVTHTWTDTPNLTRTIKGQLYLSPPEGFISIGPFSGFSPAMVGSILIRWNPFSTLFFGFAFVPGLVSIYLTFKGMPGKKGVNSKRKKKRELFSVAPIAVVCGGILSILLSDILFFPYNTLSSFLNILSITIVLSGIVGIFWLHNTKRKPEVPVVLTIIFLVLVIIGLLLRLHIWYE